MRVAYLSAGTVGAGHAVRGLALQRAVVRQAAAVQLQIFVPDPGFAGLPREDVTPLDVVRDSDLLARDRVLQSPLAAALQAFAPDLVLVDLFWLPFQALLGELRLPAWLLLRSFPSWWFQGPNGHRFDCKVYGRILATEPWINSVVRERIEPIVIVNPDECQPPQRLREHFGVDPKAKVHVLLHAGVGEELTEIHRKVGQKDAFALDLRDAQSLFPAAAWLGGADAIVSAAGYNSYYEAKWLGYFERCHFLALPRQIDDQAARIRKSASFIMRNNGADQLVKLLQAGG